VTPDDAAAGNQNNNASYREVSVSGSGTNWDVRLHRPDAAPVLAIRAWKDDRSASHVERAPVPGDGLIVVGSRATDVGNGRWHYEYAIYNMNCDASVGRRARAVSPERHADEARVPRRRLLERRRPGKRQLQPDGLDHEPHRHRLRVDDRRLRDQRRRERDPLGTTYNFRLRREFAAGAGLVASRLVQDGGNVPGHGRSSVGLTLSPMYSFCHGDGSRRRRARARTRSPTYAYAGCANTVGQFRSAHAQRHGEHLERHARALGRGHERLAVRLLPGQRLESGGMGYTFGDGLRCAGGFLDPHRDKFNAERQLAVSGPRANLRFRSPRYVQPGETRSYQVLYRDATSVCGQDNVNLTNAWQVTWQP
jgi:hypothetical protein